MKKTTTLTRDDVKAYLQQYHIAKRKKHILEERHRKLSSELRAPSPGSAFHTTPSAKNQDPEGAVSIVFRIAEVEERIEGQREEMTKAVLHVMDLIDLLPQGSMERTVVELRHIDSKGWDQISREVYMSRSRVFDYYNSALDKLLEYSRARKVVGDFQAGKNGG